jgi:hypothetical protein
MTDVLKKECIKPFGIKLDHVRSAVKRPDQTDVIEKGVTKIS